MNYSLEEKKSHEKFSRKLYNQKPECKKKRRENQKRYREKYPERVKEINKKCYYKFRSERLANAKTFQKKPCLDPILKDTVTYNCLTLRIRNHPEIYEGIKVKDCLIHIPTIKGLNLLSDEQKKELNI